MNELEIKCLMLPAGEQDVRNVFLNPDVASRYTGGEHTQINIRGKDYFVADWAKYRQEEQVRAAVEIMGYVLSDFPDLSGIDIDSGGKFCLRRTSGRRESGKTTKISGVPGIHEIYTALPI
ncbi:MAG: hypothetical protein KC506_01010 [Nanoarchaeota archaeon]|nr:hypothetical protein [Nanoarchaeota archaeon]